MERRGEISVSKPDRLIVWIRRDLRVQDNLALWSATQDAGSVIPLFIIDRDFLSLSPFRRHVMLKALAGLRDDLRRIGGVLIIRTGEPAEVLNQLFREARAAGVYLTASNEPAVRRRDDKLRSEVESAGRVWRSFAHNVIFDAGAVLTSAGTPFRVFTPYRRAWLARRDDIAPPLPSLLEMNSPVLDPGELPRVTPSEFPSGARLPEGGEKSAISTLRSFLGERVGSYAERRDVPGADGTSRLSHHLAIGSLGVRTVYKAIRDARRDDGNAGASAVQRLEGIEKFLTQIIWRDFYNQVLSHFPHVVDHAFRKEFDDLPWITDDGPFNAWREGLTGYPVVDAAMRQLRMEGWMHNRGRMIVSGFLTKDLHIDWRMGEKHFMEWLADGDLALNNGGWQWSAGTGTDAQPWHRIFNPVLQGRRFDPGGSYVKKYVPELSRVPARYLHSPWEMPERVQRESGVIIGRQYPAPIVNHPEERARALGKFRHGKKSAMVPAAKKAAMTAVRAGG